MHDKGIIVHGKDKARGQFPGVFRALRARAGPAGRPGICGWRESAQNCTHGCGVEGRGRRIWAAPSMETFPGVHHFSRRPPLKGSRALAMMAAAHELQ